MKVGLISRGRTNSTAVIASLAHDLKIVNLSEIYTEVNTNITRQYEIKRKYKKQVISTQIEFNDFKSGIVNKTASLFHNNNFIIKIWPSMICYPTYKFYKHQTFNEIQSQIIFNISKYLKLNQYDTLYFLDKNLYHSTLSWVYSKKNQIWHKKKNTRHYMPITTLDTWDYDYIRFYVLEYCLQHKIKEYLIFNKIPFTDITNNVNLYINPKILDIEETNINYKTILANSDEIYQFISDWYKICIDNMNHWYFY